MPHPDTRNKSSVTWQVLATLFKIAHACFFSESRISHRNRPKQGGRNTPIASRIEQLERNSLELVVPVSLPDECFESRLDKKGQKFPVYQQRAVVIDQSHIPEPIHKEAHPCTGCADHFR